MQISIVSSGLGFLENHTTGHCHMRVGVWWDQFGVCPYAEVTNLSDPLGAQFGMPTIS